MTNNICSIHVHDDVQFIWKIENLWIREVKYIKQVYNFFLFVCEMKLLEKKQGMIHFIFAYFITRPVTEITVNANGSRSKVFGKCQLKRMCV